MQLADLTDQLLRLGDDALLLTAQLQPVQALFLPPVEPAVLQHCTAATIASVKSLR